MDDIFERHIHFYRLKYPRDLLKNLDTLCKAKNLELVSVELRNDIYVMRFKRLPRKGSEAQSHEIQESCGRNDSLYDSNL
ncbi:hypothetical protein F4860DRAFT_50349 [Xylaria cubensis]|nr:hypothetical protein F4860DRAFT_50349 [Xylaria cubensis]